MRSTVQYILCIHCTTRQISRVRNRALGGIYWPLVEDILPGSACYLQRWGPSKLWGWKTSQIVEGQLCKSRRKSWLQHSLAKFTKLDRHRNNSLAVLTFGHEPPVQAANPRLYLCAERHTRQLLPLKCADVDLRTVRPGDIIIPTFCFFCLCLCLLVTDLFCTSSFHSQFYPFLCSCVFVFCVCWLLIPLCALSDHSH